MNTIPDPNHFSQLRKGSLQSDTWPQHPALTLLAFQFLHRAGPHVGPSGHSQESGRRPMPITLWLRHQTGRVPAGEDSGTCTKARLPASPLQMFQVKNSLFRGPLAQNPSLRIKTKYLLCHQKKGVLREKNESWTLFPPC